jgi:hypothetical protein
MISKMVVATVAQTPFNVHQVRTTLSTVLSKPADAYRYRYVCGWIVTFH